MTPRTQRRAAERKTRKSEEKKQRNLAQAQTAALSAIIQPSVIAQPPAQVNPPLSRELKLAAASSSPSLTTTISEAQLAANRTNSQLSQGPITDEGKSISARNNFRHGLNQDEGEVVLLSSESSKDYAQSLAAFIAEWQPTTPTELDLVNRLTSHQWLRRRALNLQKRFLSPEEGLILDEKQFNLYRRYEVQHERAFNKAFSDLLRLRALRTKEQNGFESQRRKNEQHEYRMRHLKNREYLQQLAKWTAEARLTIAQSKRTSAGLTDFAPGALVQLNEEGQPQR